MKCVPWLLGTVAAALLLCGCESTQQRSAELQRSAKHETLSQQGVSVKSENPSVTVLRSTVVDSREGAAVVVALRNSSSRTLENAPIEITVHNAHGGTLFQNNAPGLEPSLTQISLLPAGAEVVWIDDQVPTTGTPTSASALVGEATRASGSIPALSVTNTHLASEAGAEATLSGTVENHSRVNQQDLVVYALASRGSKLVAAGRAVLPEVLAGASVQFQIYFVGDPSGTRISTSAPPTSF